MCVCACVCSGGAARTAPRSASSPGPGFCRRAPCYPSRRIDEAWPSDPMVGSRSGSAVGVANFVGSDHESYKIRVWFWIKTVNSGGSGLGDPQNQLNYLC